MLDFGEDLIRENSSPESFRRGEDYYRRGCVTSLIRRGVELQAEVVGSQFAPYGVRVCFDEAGIMAAWCSCPYDWGGFCKHIIATLLCAIHEPDSVRELPALEDELSNLDREQLQDILLSLADRDPRLTEVIEREVCSPGVPSSDPHKASGASVDAYSIRFQVHSVIRSLQFMQPSEAFWHVGGVVEEVRRLLEVAWALIEAGDSRNALFTLEAITDEYTQAWEFLDDSDGYVGDFFYELGEAWTEALLSAELNRSESGSWGEKIEAWCEELEMYAGAQAFYPALLAAEHGWNYPPLARVLAKSAEAAESGDSPEPEEHYDEGYDGDLIVAGLHVLERQGSYEEYLHLAGYVDDVSRYAVMLVRLGRTNEALEYGLNNLRSAGEALTLAEALQEREELEGALRIGEHGLSLEGRKARLAAWVRDLASGMGLPEQALRAAVIAFHEDPSLAAYLKVQELANERWPEYREGLLDHLRRSGSYHPAGHVEVFLHEGLIQDAITAIEMSPSATLIKRVAETAVDSHPNWVISVCRPRAEEIMDQGRSKHYSEAVDWLGKVKTAHLAAGSHEEWRKYLESLIARHQRKYKLRPMLESLK